MFLIYTPIIIIASWILTIIVDDPSKDWAYELDVQSRLNRPPIKQKDLTEKEKEEFWDCWSFTKRSWKILAFVVWLLLVLIITESYQALRDPPVRHENEVPKELYATQ